MRESDEGPAQMDHDPSGDSGPGRPASPTGAAFLARLSDAELCDLIRDEGPGTEPGRAAYAELYARYRDAAFARAIRVDQDRFRAEDAVSEAFAKTLQAMHRGLGPKESFVGYLFTAVRGEAARRTAVESASDAYDASELEALPEFSTESLFDAGSELDQLEAAFYSLPGNWQQVLWLVEVQGLSVPQAAQRMSAPRAGTEKALQRAREALRTAFLQQYAEEAPPECAEVAVKLAGRVRGSLGRRDDRQVAAHLEGCARCSKQESRLRHLNERLRVLFGPIAIGGGAALATPTWVGDEAQAAAVERGAAWYGWLLLPGTALVLLGGFLLLPQDPVEGSSPGPEGVTLSEHAGSARNGGATADAADGSDTGSTRDPRDPRQPWQDDRTPFWIVIDG